MAGRKVSDEVVGFMTLFAQVKGRCNDAPEELVGLAKADPSTKDLCSDLFFEHSSLHTKQRSHRALFAAPVDPGFLTAWRDYEERYNGIVSDIKLGDLIRDSGIGEPSQAPKADVEWDNADYLAEEPAGAIEAVMEFVELEAEEDEGRFPEESFEQIQEGISAWKKLKADIGFDLRGVFRRRELVPFMLIPRQVAAKHASAEKLSMLKNLQQAHDAFVYGATYAALALMRSITEIVLRDHYGADGANLKARIREARDRLPCGASAADLHRLRNLANAILHVDPEKDEGLSGMDGARLEKEIAALLRVLCALIEGVK